MATVETEDLAYSDNPQAYFEAVRDLPGAVWLDSGKPLSLQGQYDIISACPQVQIDAVWDGIRITDEQGRETTGQGPALEEARSVLARLGPVTGDVHHLPFVGGLIGIFGYELGRQLNGLPRHGKAEGDDLMHLGCYTWSLVVDHLSQTTTLAFHPACPAELRQRIRARLTRPDTPSPSDPFRLEGPFAPSAGRGQYLAGLERIARYIDSGDCYQVNFARQFTAGFSGDPYIAYRHLRAALPSPYSGYMGWGDSALLCLSPERFLRVRDGKVETKPIKGTAPRGSSREEDDANARALRNSAKDRAENLMIVDLLRNDLGRCCETGSVRVPELFALESFANVHHLVSTVEGRLRPDRDCIAALGACLPGGSVTGAPKRRAMEIIDELEGFSRGVYCGSLGYISVHGRMDTNIAIRTLFAQGDQLYCWGGGGIVADSEPDREYRETLDKVGVLMETLEQMESRQL